MVSIVSAPEAMAPPPTIPKRPAMSMKRSSSYIDPDDSQLPASLKKLKVAFDPNVDVRIMDDWSDKSFELVREEVRIAIERHSATADRKDDTHYQKLLQVLELTPMSAEAPSAKLLRRYLLALDTRVSALGECGRLAVAAINIAWLGRDEAFVSLYVKFLCDLASAHPKFVSVILGRLIAHFTKLPAALGRLPEEVPVSRTTMFARLHSVIRILLRQIPSANNALMRLAKSQFPNDVERTRPYLQYQKHFLRVGEYAPELKFEILVTIMQRLVDTDVQIQQDLEDFEDEAEERILQQRPRTSDINAEESDVSDSDSDSETEESITEDEQRLRELRLKVAKMDATLDLLFDHYTPLIQDGSRPENNDAYHQLLAHFTSFILPNRSRHAQFLLFHFAQTSPAHSDVFINQCLQLASREGGHSTQRLTALAYVSSFVARGAHLQSEAVRRVVTTLCNIMDSARQRYEPLCRGPDRRAYGIYYAVAQSLLYIFCFRWRDLVDGSSSPELDAELFNADDAIAEGRDLVWFAGFKETMTRNLYGRMNPLKVCSQAIVSEFAQIANHLRFLYIFPILETNRRIRLGQPSSYYGVGDIVDICRRETAWDRKKGEAHHQLEAYFPFDPYHLPGSKRWIEEDYNEWKLPGGMRQDDVEELTENESESEEEESEGESVDDELISLSTGDLLPPTPDSLKA